MRDRFEPSGANRWGSFVLSCVAVGVVFGACQASHSPGESPGHVPRLFDGLGAIHHPISTGNPEAQRYFDQGLALAFGFNHDGAIDAFREAARLDPGCAICWWGIAFASGPNINAPMGPEAGREAWRAAQEAKRLARHANPAEVEYIEAIQLRYSADADATAGSGGAPNRRSLDEAFARAMGGIASRHPEDADAQALHAESLLDLSPWNYWHDDGSPREFTHDAAAAIEAALARNPDHTGALHYKIHLYERFEPEKAEDAADRLATQAPDAGHLVHMPAHIYYRVGRYRDAAEINEAAAAADVAYFSWCRAPAAYAALYYTHNLHFLWASHMVEGRSDAAMTAARRLVAQIPLDRLPEFPFLEDFLVVPLYTQARFGSWDEILGEPRPPAGQRFVTAIWHYARGLAYARTGKPAEAQAELAALVAIAADPALAATGYDTSGGTAGQRLDLARHHLAAEIAAARGDGRTAVAELRAGIEIQDAMPYAEPPPFYFPLRQALGAVLLASGRPDQAEAVYLEDLRRHPRTGWSLFGLSKSYAAQGKSAQAKATLQGYRNAWARADVELDASRF
jgi:tetratricopeptide (TPR) repeat protein